MLIPVLLAGGVVYWLWSLRQAPLTGQHIFIDSSEGPMGQYTSQGPPSHRGREADVGDVIHLSPVGLRSVSTSKPNLLRPRSPTEFVVLDSGRVTIAYDRGLVHVDVPPLGAVF